MNNQYYIPSQSDQLALNILKIIKSKDVGVIQFPPNTGKSNRLINTVLERNKDKLSKFIIEKIDFTIYEYEDLSELTTELDNKVKKANKKDIFFIVTNAQSLILDGNYSYINAMIDLHERYANVQLILCLNVDITHPNILKRIRTSLFGYIYYYPLYERNDIIGFINHYSRLWDLNLDIYQIDLLIESCGGYFWLLKQALICLKENPRSTERDIFHYEGIKIALEQLYDSFTDSERGVLHSLVLNHQIQDHVHLHSLNFLSKCGLVRDNKITFKLLSIFIKKHLPRMIVEINNNRILINSVNVDNNFSKKEKKLLKILIENKNLIVSRDNIAKVIWSDSDDESYSDWAVDRLVARLRSKIKSLGMIDSIRTIRNKGYQFSD